MTCTSCGAQSLDALRGTASHAAMARLAIRCGEAGMAAFDGNLEPARGGLLAAYDELREIGAARLQALTGLAMATLVGPGDPRVRAAIDESRRLFERMGAGFWLARLDAALAAGPGVPSGSASGASGRTAAPDPPASETPLDRVPR